MKTFISGQGYVGEWELDKVNEYKRQLRKEAKRVLKEKNADHVVYNMTMYKDGQPDKVYFYMLPMGEDEFFKKIGELKGDFTIGAVHRF